MKRMLIVIVVISEVTSLIAMSKLYQRIMKKVWRCFFNFKNNSLNINKSLKLWLP